MSNLVEMITSQLGGAAISQITQQLGVNQEQTQSAMGSLIPVLIGAMAKNSSNQEGAEALSGALDRDHDGSILDNLGGFLGNSAEGPGAGILKHLLGGKRGAVEQVVSQNSGLSQQQTGGLMEMLAPVIMGQLGKTKKEQGLDTSGLSDLLQGANNQARADGPDLGMLGKLLIDADGDGDIKDDLLRLGGKFLGNMFGGKR